MRSALGSDGEVDRSKNKRNKTTIKEKGIQKTKREQRGREENIFWSGKNLIFNVIEFIIE